MAGHVVRPNLKLTSRPPIHGQRHPAEVAITVTVRSGIDPFGRLLDTQREHQAEPIEISQDRRTRSHDAARITVGGECPALSCRPPCLPLRSPYNNLIYCVFRSASF